MSSLCGKTKSNCSLGKPNPESVAGDHTFPGFNYRFKKRTCDECKVSRIIGTVDPMSNTDLEAWKARVWPAV